MKKFLISATLFLSLFRAPNYASVTIPPEAIPPLPLAKQVAWQQMETLAFVHFGLNTFDDKEWGYGDVSPQVFNPTKLDCEQWVRTFLAAGIKEVIITAKHHDGFCLWPTMLTDYCIRNTPYKNGKGDVVGELSAACKKYGLKFGVYLSPWDRHQANYGTPEYVEYFYKQLRELLTRYGDISEVWFDGANGGDGWYGGAKEVRKIDRKTYYHFERAYKMVEELQPNAIIFSDGGPGCRWIGNEMGFAGATNWAFLRSKEVYPGYEKYPELQYGHADGDKWVPGECDVSIRLGWFYHPSEDKSVKSIEQLVDLYYRSVGHNANLLLNFPINREGLVSKTDSVNAVNYHLRIQKELSHNLFAGIIPKASNERGEPFSAQAVTDGNYHTYWATQDGVTEATLEFRLPSITKINRLLLQEYIPLGQRVKSFVVEYYDSGKWQTVNPNEETTTIGYKRILRFPTLSTNLIRICFIDSRACLCINNVEAFYSGSDDDTSYNAVDKKMKIKGYPFVLIGQDSAEMKKCMDHNSTTTCFIKDQTVLVDLGEKRLIHSFLYLPDQSNKGLIANYELSAGIAKDDLNTIIASGEFSNIRNNPVWQTIHFAPVYARYLLFKASRMIDAEQPMGIAELRVE
ncbi:alpha-L-fucosidase [uncultured Bacteroides sp.]|uniref:alpha-L-fucosidase n=1 Tax=uncultured Bacteroides sp. TaxID=162156 RepID=UPI002AAC41A9|nr:alpha-L-fucosidase [uncultured Bacteroides sp.]